MSRSMPTEDDPNPELGRVEHALIFIALCAMLSFLVRELYGWARGVKKIRRLQSEVDAIVARGDAQASDHSD